MGGIETFNYNNDRELTKRTMKDSQSITYQYDTLGRLSKVTYPDDTVTYAYNSNSLITNASNNEGNVSYNHYYADLISKERTSITGYPTKEVKYDVFSPYWYVRGDITTERKFDYDTTGRLSDIADADFYYDKSGKMSRTYISGGYDNFTYDAAGRLTKIDPAAGTDIDYTYDKTNNILSKATSLYGYDPVYQLITGTNPVETYTYDKVGNRLTSTGVNYTYDAHNKLISMTGGTFTYDLNGNMTSKTIGGVTTNYTWNSKGQLTKAVKGTMTVDYIYDAIGRRTIKKINDNGVITQRRYIHQGDQVIEIRDGSDNEVLQIFNGPRIDMLMYAKKGATTYRYYRDHLGNITQITDGTNGYTYSYDAFGNPTIAPVNAPTVENPFMFNGREWDSEVGLYYYRARYYDPELGRFISADPINLSGGINLYAYVGGNPVNRVDPFGLDWLQYDLSDRMLSHYPGDMNTSGPPQMFPSLSGPWGRGALPSGNYTGSNLRRRQKGTAGMVCDGKESGWSLDLSDKDDRTLLRIHPDQVPYVGTSGCIGVNCAYEQQAYDALREYFDNGNSTINLEVIP